MLLETVAAPITAIPANPTAGGPVTIDTSNLPKTVRLSGSGPGWSALGGTLTLKPATEQMLPVWYRLTFGMDLGTSYSLLGAQVFTPGDSSSIVFFPASENAITIDLMSNVDSGGAPVSYTLTLGFLASDGITQVWVDPTITFDPQG